MQEIQRGEMLMALVHDFLLLEGEELLDPNLKKNRDVVEIDDDIILYINDSLKWVPQAQNAYLNEKKYGLNYYGFTYFDKDGVEILYQILKAWSDLFKNSPPKLKLTGQYYWLEGENINSGKYERIELDRDTVIEKFQKLMAFAEKVMNHDYELVHFGI